MQRFVTGFIRIILILFFLFSFPGSLCLALNKKDSLSLSHYIMALYYDNIGESDLAVKDFEKALKLDPDNYLTHFSLALTLVKKKEISRAEKELKYAVKINPEAAEPHALLAILNLVEGNLDLAAKEYERALKGALRLNPKDLDVYKSLGVLYLRQGNLKEALSTYRLISEISPYDPEMHFYLGVIYAELKEKILFEKELKKAISIRPDYAEALNFLGYTYVEESRNLKEAEDLIKKAIEVDPDNGAYLDSLGWLYYKKGNFKKAKELLIRAASLMPDPVIYDHLGDLYFKMKGFDDALANWQESLRLNPDQEKVKEKLQGLKNKWNTLKKK
ncbi:MAG: tetratricopeptide repeat protein [Candidatus Omnitrophica bacterium]|nr:tetratricopeptide repeat protein [Candidatus Omnitrophota bacterium]